MPEIDYNLIRDIGGAKARGAAEATSQLAGEAQLTDYLARTGAKARAGGGDLTAFYEQETETANYQRDLETNLPLLMEGMKAGNEEFVQKINADMKAKYPNLHKTEITGLVPGQKLDLVSIQSGADVLKQDPNLEGRVDPTANFQVSTSIGADGQVQVTGIQPAGAGELPTAAKTITTDKGIMQWNPATQRYDIPAGGAPVRAGGPGGAGSTASLKWDKDALGALKTQYGTLTDTGYVIDDARMAEYQDAITYLNDYKTKGLGPNESSVLAERRAKAGGIDPIQEVITQQKGLGKSDKEIKALLRKSQFKSVNPGMYGLK